MQEIKNKNKPEEEVDPLDAFMAGIENEVNTKQQLQFTIFKNQSHALPLAIQRSRCSQTKRKNFITFIITISLG